MLVVRRWGRYKVPLFVEDASFSKVIKLSCEHGFDILGISRHVDCLSEDTDLQVSLTHYQKVWCLISVRFGIVEVFHEPSEWVLVVVIL